MADIKFSCSECGQHIACDDTWGGHEIECPACRNPIVVPQAQLAPAAPVAINPMGGSRAAGPKLAAGATQVPRSIAPAPVPTRRPAPGPPRSDNALLKYGVVLVVVAALAGIGYFYGLPLVSHAFQQEPNAKQSANGNTAQTGGTMGGPMGEVNAAMDVSDALDGGSSPKRRPVPATNNAARPRPAIARP